MTTLTLTITLTDVDPDAIDASDETGLSVEAFNNLWEALPTAMSSVDITGVVS